MRETNFKHEEIPASELELDIGVNPRMPSKEWIRRTMLEGYEPALLGLFIVSERIRNGERALVLLDGGNRRDLMIEAQDQDRLVECRVFYGLTRAEEAAIARRYNNRRQWTSVKLFLNDVTAGNEDAMWIHSTLIQCGWDIGSSTKNGVLRSVVPLQRVLNWGHKFDHLNEAKQALATAMTIYTAAWPTQPPSYASDVMEGLAYLLLREGNKMDVERLTKVLSEFPGGQRGFIRGAEGVRVSLQKYRNCDAVAYQSIQAFNKNKTTRRIDDNWTPWTLVRKL